jgi:alkylation response protein AidB-like acyl-CoA dehydrogenase
MSTDQEQGQGQGQGQGQRQDQISLGREQLAAWESAKPKNYLQADRNLQHLLKMHLGQERYRDCWPMLNSAAELAAGPLDRLARESNRDENLPRLNRYDGIGRLVEQVEFTPAYHEVGALIWSTGVLNVLGDPGNELLSGALAYFIDHNGEAGHACPVACTAGLIKLLQQVGSDEQQQRYLPSLLETDYSKRLHAAQFVTEVQGGSDVGQNACVATPDSQQPGIFRISGEKWFCSVMDAQLFVMTARPAKAREGTAGLGLFLVPRQVEGQNNNFAIRRLKYKLGTRSMASGEADFDGALAEPLGQLDRGFKSLISIVLDTSRVHNAVAACGFMRRALIEAHTFASHRVAFGVKIIEHPMVQEVLARMKVITCAATATTFRVLALSDRIATSDGVLADLRQARRTHVNINKYWTAIGCTEVVRSGIEVLGGNGTIEEFSVLPRLYRDSIVLESWEGTHNTLCAQVLRDFAKRGLQRPWLAEIEGAMEGLTHDTLRGHHERVTGLHREVAGQIDRLLTGDAERASLNIRHLVNRMCVLNSYLSLLLESQWGLEQGIDSDKGAIVELYRHLFVDPVDLLENEALLPLYRQVVGSL